MTEEGNDTTIIISGQIESWKETLLLVWFLAWTACGFFVALQLLQPQEGQVFLFILIYLAFWSYFEYKVAYAWFWRKWGFERIHIDAQSIGVKRDVRGYGKAKMFFRDNVRNIKLAEENRKSFAQSYSKSWWVVGGETILFNHFQDRLGFGMQLDPKDSKALLSYIKNRLKR